ASSTLRTSQHRHRDRHSASCASFSCVPTLIIRRHLQEFPMRTAEDIESFMLDSGYYFERLGDEIWHVSDEDNGIDNIIVFFSGNIINVQVRLFRLPDIPSKVLLRRLLELNATSVMHGAFGIENNHVVLIGALELDHLD